MRVNKDNKYYVLTIEDVEFGLEYEERIEDEWIGKVCDLSITTPDIINLDTDISKYYYIKHNDYRVKHLDREDIESFGWEGDEMEAWKDDKRRFLYHKKCTTPRGEQNCSIFHVPHTNWVMIYFSTDEFGSYVWELPEDKITFTGGTAFTGVIKNKSELGVILKQIGVL